VGNSKGFEASFLNLCRLSAGVCVNGL
jgi:hypothetical protein